jgi:chromosome segregation ATPase
MYIKKLDSQLEKTLDQNKEISEKYDLTQNMLNEKSSIIKTLQEKLANFELKSNDLDDQNRHLKETLKDLNKQIKEMEDISSQRQSMIAGFHHGENLNDISLDNPGGILSPPPGESMGDMVVLNLQEDNAALRSELTENQEKYQNIQKDYESEQETSRKNAELNKNLEGKLDTQLGRVESLVKKLGDEHSNLKQVQQSLDMAQQENANIKVNNCSNYVLN